MAFIQQMGMLAGAAALGRIGDLTNVKALNPFDVFDSESVNLTQQDGAILQNMGNEAANLTPPAQGALLGLAVAMPGGRALYNKKILTAIALGLGVGALGGWYFGKKKR
jgi:hypothetical protein